MDKNDISEFQQKFGSWDYLFGKPLPFSFSCEERFVWGNVQLQLQVESGIILHAKVYSDAMDHLLAPKLEQALTNCRFTLPDLHKAVQGCLLNSEAAYDICNMLTNMNI